ncbi:NAD(+) diphosphatase [Oleiagrimonas soli]|uniref:NAD(+) diphosphatase n=1 Tax=Oleiagrimonas soli TaxID=1543381 RepID=A0A099CUS1_9GAMM|nr:NAD(+) diphosphatase [Oleiagrimonas soli]KGI76765.1 NUDIX hydrolase [Oleiagrimonas soli]MBB6184997.1 NAD+ diphosphatase [Oleiagrimonas soli]
MDLARQPPLNTFAGLALERAAERREDDAWLHALQRDDATRFLVLDPDAQLFADAEGLRPRLLTPDERATLLPDADASLLGVDAGGRGHFLLRADAIQAARMDATLDTQRIHLRKAGMLFDAFDAGLFAYASGLAHWQARHRFCPACGGALELLAAGHRARCTRCGQLQFPRSDPAIIVIVEHDGACLLGRQASWPEGRYSTLAGFVEPGESLEDAVRREVAEEAGVAVGACHYHSSQPWPFPASLMLGFTAHARSRAIELRDGELEHARWFTPEQLIEGIEQGSLLAPTRLSVSWRLIEHWLRERAGIELGALCEAAATT